MRILLELPTWLGDAVMATPVIEHLAKEYPKADIILVGSQVSTKALSKNPHIKRSIPIPKNYIKLYYKIKSLGHFDISISLRSSFRAKFLLYVSDSKKKYLYQDIYPNAHQVLRYLNFIKDNLNIKIDDNPKLSLSFEPYSYEKPTIGINPGATYGSAKRWYPKEFAALILKLSSYYDVVILGSKNELKLSCEITTILDGKNISNYTNLVGQTDIPNLISKIAGLKYFFTNDSGPMHIAAAYKIPTIAIFGPTDYVHTRAWDHDESIIVTKNLYCSPCMKRECPLKTHDCMKQIKAVDVYSAYTKLKNEHTYSDQIKIYKV